MPQSIRIRTALLPKDLSHFVETVFTLYPEIEAALECGLDNNFREDYTQKQLEKHYNISFKSLSSVNLWLRSKPQDQDIVKKFVQIVYYYIGAANCLIIDGENGPHSFWGPAKREDGMLSIEKSIQEFVEGFQEPGQFFNLS